MILWSGIHTIHYELESTNKSTAAVLVKITYEGGGGVTADEQTVQNKPEDVFVCLCQDFPSSWRSPECTTSLPRHPWLTPLSLEVHRSGRTDGASVLSLAGTPVIEEHEAT